MHHFESLLPRLPGARRIELHNPLPHVALRPLWGALRSRLLWIVIVVVAAVSALAAWTSLDERWYVYREDVHFNGLNYLNAEDLWETSAVDGWQIFWIDGDAVRERLLQNRYVADAQVHITTLLTKMTVDVTEVRPVALWETDAGLRWLRDDGIALEPRGQTPPGLLLIHDPPADATLAGAPNGAAIDPAVLASAQALANRLPGVTPLRYNALVGLNFPAAGSTVLGLLGRRRRGGEEARQPGGSRDAAQRWPRRGIRDRRALRATVHQIRCTKKRIKREAVHGLSCEMEGGGRRCNEGVRQN